VLLRDSQHFLAHPRPPLASSFRNFAYCHIETPVTTEREEHNRHYKLERSEVPQRRIDKRHEQHPERQRAEAQAPVGDTR
jgi:hypothetical protein